MKLEGKVALVTGGCGFIGSHLVERLVREKATVKVLGRYNSQGSTGWLDDSPTRDETEIILGDVRDQDCVRKSCEGVDVVFHLAALIGIPYSYTAPQSYVETNITGTLNVLQAARQLETPRVIHTSTSEVYGSALRVPIDESHPLQGQSPYSASKIGADKLAESFHLSFGTPVVTARPFNTFGPRQSARAVIPTIIKQALAGQEKIRLGNLSPTRDFNFVQNTVDGFITLATSPEVEGQTFNFGYGKEISIGDLAELIFELVGTSCEIQSESDRQRPKGSEVDRLLADTTRAHRQLGWEPRVSLKEGLKMTIEWLRTQNLVGAHRYTV